MVTLATEMERQGFEIPLLIGGATTSRAHTAVKVDQRYHGPVVWVKDASRSVPVASTLLSDGPARASFLAEVTRDYDSLRERHAAKSTERPLVSLEQARANATPVDWPSYRPPVPHMITRQTQEVGVKHWHPRAATYVRTFSDYPLDELRRYIDWTPFFLAWEMKGRYPDILHQPATAEAARRLHADANQMLDRIIAERWLRASGVVGLFPAAAVGDDIEVYADSVRAEPLATVHGPAPAGRPPRRRPQPGAERLRGTQGQRPAGPSGGRSR